MFLWRMYPLHDRFFYTKNNSKFHITNNDFCASNKKKNKNSQSIVTLHRLLIHHASGNSVKTQSSFNQFWIQSRYFPNISTELRQIVYKSKLQNLCSNKHFFPWIILFICFWFAIHPQQHHTLSKHLHSELRKDTHLRRIKMCAYFARI